MMFGQTYQDLLAKIQYEAGKNQAYHQTNVLSTVYGARLTGTNSLEASGKYVEATLGKYGLKTQRHEWKFGRQWQNFHVSARLIEPNPEQLLAVATPWTGSTNGRISAPVVLGVPHGESDPTKREEVFKKFMEGFREGELKGKIILDSPLRPTASPAATTALTLSEDDIKSLQGSGPPCPVQTYQKPIPAVPTDPKLLECFWRQAPQWAADTIAAENKRTRAMIYAFYKRKGAIAVINSDRGEGGTMFPFSGDLLQPGEEVWLPMVTLPKEHFNRLVRLIQLGKTPTVEMEVRSEISDEAVSSFNITADILGSTKPEEIVILGCHLDSAPFSNGATDNAVGCGVLLDAARVITTLEIKPQRTIRFAFFTGEEQGRLGSKAYVLEHFGNPETGVMKPGHEKLAAAFIQDSGAGKIRGLIVPDNDPAKATLTKWFNTLRPFQAHNIVSRSTLTGNSDHSSFRAAGIPAFQFLQDPLNYQQRTWHSSYDSMDYVPEADVRQATTVATWIALQAANAEEKLPRP